MKNLILAAFMLFVGGSVMAQGKGGQGPRGGGGMEQMAEKLKLTEDQQKLITDVNNNFRKSMESLRNDQSLSEEKIGALRQSLMEERNRKFQEILTPEQLALYQDMKYNRQGGMNVQELKAKLNLTDEQTSKFNELEMASMEKNKSVMGNSSMTPEQRASFLEQMNKSKYENLKVILTPEQMINFDQLMKNNGM